MILILQCKKKDWPNIWPINDHVLCTTKNKERKNETMLFLKLMKTKFGKFDSKCFNYEHFDADCIMMNEYRKKIS